MQLKSASTPPTYAHPAGLLQQLIRFDTTNPPGNEAACIAFIAGLLSEAGIEHEILALSPARPNLLARLPGRGDAPPLLLYGHIDVVTTAGQAWRYPPFEGVEAGGYIWGRGALDMKGGIAMLLSALLRAKAEGLQPPGDILLAVLADEENFGACGAGYLVEQHAGRFAGVRHALGEFGGFSIHIGGKKFYPVMVAEKQACALRAVMRGPAGHGSLPMRGGTMARLARLIQLLDQRRLPVHITPPARLMIEALSRSLSFPTGWMLGRLLHPALTGRVLDLLGERGRTFEPLLHNTVNATIVRGGDKINVIPCELALELDGRLLPGFGPLDMLREVRELAGDLAEWEVTYFDPCPATLDMSLFDTLAGILKEADPAGIPIPLLLGAVTDGRYFSRLGIQTYGFLPMDLPESFDFSSTIHAADERIPVGAVAFGAHAIYKAIQSYSK